MVRLRYQVNHLVVNSKGNTMELSDKEATAVKAIYSDFHAGATNAEEALHALEQLINGDND